MVLETRYDIVKYLFDCCEKVDTRSLGSQELEAITNACKVILESLDAHTTTKKRGESKQK